MHYGSAGGWDLGSKILGAYEAELHQELDVLIEQGYDRVINVGCAEGYYAVGLSLRLPDAEIWAFDIDARAQRSCRRLADRNGVGSRLHINGECTAQHLDSLIDGRTLLVVDIEGAEMALLDANAAPKLAEADVLVELHDFVDSSISPTLLARFAPTHDCSLVDSTPRHPDDYVELRSLPWRDRMDVVDERRPAPMQWAIFRSLKQERLTDGSPAN